MKFLNYIFFNVYRHNYEKKLEGRIIDPASWTSFMLGVGIGGWSLFIVFLFDLISKKNVNPNIYEIICCFSIFISGGLINNYYTNNYKYLDVYKDYVTNNRVKNKRKGWLLSYCLIIFPYIISILLAILLGKTK
jgi:hypothetical protein